MVSVFDECIIKTLLRFVIDNVYEPEHIREQPDEHDHQPHESEEWQWMACSGWRAVYGKSTYT